jgi:hypothetical protein
MITTPPQMLSSNLLDPYFLSLYYLENRLTQPQTPRDEIVENMYWTPQEDILAYKHLMIPFAYLTTGPAEERGLIFCQSHTMLPEGLPEDVDWHIVKREYQGFERLQRLGLFQWDYVVLVECPIMTSLVELEEALRAGRWLLRPGGQLLIAGNHFEVKELERIMMRELFSSLTQVGDDFILEV